MSFTIKRIIIRHRAYIAVWQKGRRGMFALKRQKKGITKKEVERILTKKIIKVKEELPITVFRVTTAFIYFGATGGEEFSRTGKLRLVVYTLKPSNFNVGVMRRLLNIGDRIIRKDRVVNRLARRRTLIAREEHIVDSDEFRRSKQPLDVVFGELAGFGIRRRKFRLNFK